ncbi:MAG: TerC family protein [Planctomycetota bacterium]
MIFENLLSIENLFAFLALAVMEIVLGIDNLVYISIVSSRLPADQQPLARRIGLLLALATRIALLFVLFLIVNNLTADLFELTSIGFPESWLENMNSFDPVKEPEQFKHAVEEMNGVSIKDIVLFLGGLFLVRQSIKEMHEQMGHDPNDDVKPSNASFTQVVTQIAIMDIVFSLDSVITAVGMVEHLGVMIFAIIAAVIVMLVFAERVSQFVETNPTVKMLALSFLILIGVMLIAEGVGAHLDKGYVYFAMAFALIVEFLNLRTRQKHMSVENSG